MHRYFLEKTGTNLYYFYVNTATFTFSTALRTRGGEEEEERVVVGEGKTLPIGGRENSPYTVVSGYCYILKGNETVFRVSYLLNFQFFHSSEALAFFSLIDPC